MSQAKLESQVADQGADIRDLYELQQLTDRRVTEVDRTVKQLATRFNGFEGHVKRRFDGLDHRIDKLDDKINALDAKFEARFDAVDARFDGLEGQMTEVLAILRTK